METLILTPHGLWLQITLNRPEAKNALNTATLAALAAALQAATADANIRAVLIHGAEGNFAAGADITEIEGKTSAQAATDPRKAHWAAIRAFPKPLIAAVDGFALGGGLELALMADLMILGDSARLGLPETNLGLTPPAHGCLQAWAERGVLLLNTVLTVEAAQAASHAGWGWEALTDALIAAVAADAPPCVFLLWGAHAQRKRALIEQAMSHSEARATHLILQANHPSPLSATRGPTPFIGCGHFGQAQAFWRAQRHTLDWALA